MKMGFKHMDLVSQKIKQNLGKDLLAADRNLSAALLFSQTIYKNEK